MIPCQESGLASNYEKIPIGEVTYMRKAPW